MSALKVLSVQQPYSYLLAHGIKDVENRNWTTRYRGLVLIHAGKKVDPGCFDGERAYSPEFYLAGGGLHIMGHVPLLKSGYETGGIVGIARLVDIVTESKSPWFRGAYGWVFDKAMPLPLIPMRGSLGLIDAPAEIVAQVRVACEKAKVSA